MNQGWSMQPHLEGGLAIIVLVKLRSPKVRHRLEGTQVCRVLREDRWMVNVPQVFFFLPLPVQGCAESVARKPPPLITCPLSHQKKEPAVDRGHTPASGLDQGSHTACCRPAHPSGLGQLACVGSNSLLTLLGAEALALEQLPGGIQLLH